MHYFNCYSRELWSSIHMDGIGNIHEDRNIHEKFYTSRQNISSTIFFFFFFFNFHEIIRY